MFELVGFLVGSVIDILFFQGSSAKRRTYEAYRDAWKRSGKHATPQNLDLLRQQFKDHSAPGAYTEPDGPALTPWIAAWESNQRPRAALRTVRRPKP